MTVPNFTKVSSHLSDINLDNKPPSVWIMAWDRIGLKTLNVLITFDDTIAVQAERCNNVISKESKRCLKSPPFVTCFHHSTEVHPVCRLFKPCHSTTCLRLRNDEAWLTVKCRRPRIRYGTQAAVHRNGNGFHQRHFDKHIRTWISN